MTNWSAFRAPAATGRRFKRPNRERGFCMRELAVRLSRGGEPIGPRELHQGDVSVRLKRSPQALFSAPDLADTSPARILTTS